MAVERWAEWHMAQVRRDAVRQRVFDWLAAILVGLVLSSVWWFK